MSPDAAKRPRKLPVDETGLMPVKIVVDGVPPVLTRTTFSPWMRLWEQVEALGINDTAEDQQVGKQIVRPGFSVWAKLQLAEQELIRSARASLKSLEERHKDEFLVQVQSDSTGLYFRKVRPAQWHERMLR